MRHKTWFPSTLLGVLFFAFVHVTPSAPAQSFVRGDVDESGVINVADAIRILQFLFQGNHEAVGCNDSADADDDGVLSITDGIFVLDFLFLSGPPLPPPFRVCGTDPTDDNLGCDTYDACFRSFLFYGVEFSADAVFYVVDQSASMWISDELTFAKSEVTRNITESNDGTEFGVVFFDRDVVRFPDDGIPAESSVETRQGAAQFIESVPGGAGSCVLEGLLAALEFAKAANVGTKLILYVGDGDGACRGQEESGYLQRTLKQVMEVNQGVASISAIGVLEPPTPNEQFLIDITEQNGGTYTRVKR